MFEAISMILKVFDSEIERVLRSHEMALQDKRAVYVMSF